LSVITDHTVFTLALTTMLWILLLVFFTSFAIILLEHFLRLRRNRWINEFKGFPRTLPIFGDVLQFRGHRSSKNNNSNILSLNTVYTQVCSIYYAQPIQEYLHQTSNHTDRLGHSGFIENLL